jgi:hypothetical protein
MLKAVTLVWTLAFIHNGVPSIQKMKPSEPMTIDECRGIIVTDTYRMHDWLRGALQAPLSAPVAVHGECEPIQQDASNEGRDPRCDTSARYEAMREGADCS